MPAELAKEKAALLAAAFPEWKKTDLTDFVSASERFGRHHHAGIASALTVSHRPMLGCSALLEILAVSVSLNLLPAQHAGC